MSEDSNVKMSPNQTEVQWFYSGSTVFLTGATGFLGKLILEKLLRACETKRIYVLLRQKKGKEENARLEELFDGPVFKNMKNANPAVLEKVCVLKGDIGKPNLGLTAADRDLVIREVNIFINCAATVSFQQKLSVAIRNNLMSARDMLDIAREARHLQAIVHVSTAYSHCPRKEIDEVNYEPGKKGTELIELLEKLGDEALDERQSELLKPWPNTYTFTKASTEDMLWDEGKGMPLAIVRPSMIVGTESEPIAGYIDNFYGPQGFWAANVVGLIRIIRAKVDYPVDYIPGDYVSNCIICAAWEVAQGCETKFYNMGSTSQNGLTWRNSMDCSLSNGAPSSRLIWYPFYIATPCTYWADIMSFFLETTPAHIMDFLALCFGKEQLIVKTTAKASKLMRSMEFFALNEWRWGDRNVRKLICKLSNEDQELFNFDTVKLDWDKMTDICSKTYRKYLLKEPPGSEQEAFRKYEIFKICHYTLVTAVLMLCYFMLRHFIKMFM